MRKVLGFLFVGGGVFLLGIFILWVCVDKFKISPFIAYPIQTIISIEANFFLNRFLNWKDQNLPISQTWIKFHTAKVVTVIIDQLLYAALVYFGVSYLLAKILNTAIFTVVNFFVNDRFVFKSNTVIEPKIVNKVWPSIVVIVPCRNSQTYIMNLLNSLYVASENYLGRVTIFLVGSKGDETWSAISNYGSKANLEIFGIAGNKRYRDSNAKRHFGTTQAIQRGFDVVFYTDTKIIVPPDIFVEGIKYLTNDVDAVAGTYRRYPNQSQWWARVQDNGLITDAPRFGTGSLLNPSKTLNMPITACLFVRLESMITTLTSWPVESAKFPSHEDTMIAKSLLADGRKIFVTDSLCVFHEHRSDTNALLIKWTRSAISVANMFVQNNKDGFARSRALKAFLVLGACALTLLFIAIFTITGGVSALLVCLSTMGVLILIAGLGNAVIAKDFFAILYPFGTGLLVLNFAITFVVTIVFKKEDDCSLLQIY